jgi:hypothetical protein
VTPSTFSYLFVELSLDRTHKDLVPPRDQGLDPLPDLFFLQKPFSSKKPGLIYVVQLTSELFHRNSRNSFLCSVARGRVNGINVYG